VEIKLEQQIMMMMLARAKGYIQNHLPRRRSEYVASGYSKINNEIKFFLYN